MVKWKSGDAQKSDIFTKNLPRPLFEKHGSNFFGVDEYMSPNHGRVSESDRSNDSKESAKDSDDSTNMTESEATRPRSDKKG